MPVIQIAPDQIPGLITENRNALEALAKVLALKRECLAHLDTMDKSLAAFDLNAAMVSFVQVQRIEYQLQVEGLEEKKRQIEGNLKQLENPVSLASAGPTIPAGFAHGLPGGKRRQ